MKILTVEEQLQYMLAFFDECLDETDTNWWMLYFWIRRN